MQKWILQVEISVSDTWVADGFEATNERIKERLVDMLPYAYGNEFKVKVKTIEQPDKKTVKELQGY